MRGCLELRQPSLAIEGSQFAVLHQHSVQFPLQLRELKEEREKNKSEWERKLMAVFKKNDGGKYRKQSIAHSALYGPDRNFTVS